MKKENKKTINKTRLKQILCILGAVGLVFGSYFSGYSAGSRSRNQISASANTQLPLDSGDVWYYTDMYGYDMLTVSDNYREKALVVSNSEYFAIPSNWDDEWYSNHYTVSYNPKENFGDVSGGSMVYHTNRINRITDYSKFNYGLLAQKNFNAPTEPRDYVYQLYSYMDFPYGEVLTTADYIYYYGNMVLPLYSKTSVDSFDSNYPYFRFCVSGMNFDPEPSENWVDAVKGISYSIKCDVYDTKEYLGSVDFTKKIETVNKLTFVTPFSDLIYEYIFKQFDTNESLGFFVKNLTLIMNVDVNRTSSSSSQCVRVQYITTLVNNRKSCSGNVVSWLQNNFKSLNMGSTVIVQEPDFDGNYAGWLGKAVGGFFEVEILPGFSLGGMLLTVIAVPIVLWLLKIFAGG